MPLTIAARFNGPDDSAHGGYACGLLAGGSTGDVAVTLHAPPRLGRPLRTEHTGRRTHLWDGPGLVATAAPTRHRVAVLDPVDPVLARAAEPGFRGRERHPFPRCFACGTGRADGLRLAPGAVEGRPDVVACTWTPQESMLAGDGRVRAEVVWAALDCPSGWTTDMTTTPMVLGWMRAKIRERPAAGRACVVVARLDDAGEHGITATSALHDDAGVLLAAATTRWYPPRG
ncbi:hypothetical protein [Lentzea sp. NPDC060358]|uniref:hypothetical protein n=1 Tax=Lentzea sp. NPDC060358 TaxID=3347103 RepID=UPI00364EC15D